MILIKFDKCNVEHVDYWVIQNDYGQLWQLCTKIYVATE
jgi:hypothetical protein